jgi:hypothetical protein
MHHLATMLIGIVAPSPPERAVSLTIIAEQPVPCFSRRGAYCLMGGDVYLKQLPDRRGRRWVEFSNPYDSEANSYIIEDRACRHSKTGNVRQRGSVKEISYRGEMFTYALVTLSRVCTISVLLSKRSSASAAIFLTYFRPCFDSKCLGPPFFKYMPRARELTNSGDEPRLVLPGYPDHVSQRGHRRRHGSSK